jgi:hypothetical protein
MSTFNRRTQRFGGKGQGGYKTKLIVVPYRIQWPTDTREGYPLARGSVIYLIQETRSNRFFLYGYTLRSSADFVAETMGAATGERLATHFTPYPEKVVPTQYDTGKERA